MSTTHSAVEYLFHSSNAGLESFQLSRLAHSADLRKELLRIVNDIVRSEAEARAALWLRDPRSADDATRETPANSFLPHERSDMNAPATRGPVSWAEARSEALPPAGKHEQAHNEFASDSFSPRDTVVESVEQPDSSCRQLRLFSCDDDAGADNPTNFDGGPGCNPPAERQFIAAHKFPGKPSLSGLLNAAGNIVKAVDPMPRLVRSAKLNRFSVASPRSCCNRANGARKIKVVVFPISGGNSIASGTKVISRALPGGEISLDRKPVSIFPRTLRNNAPVTLGSPFAFVDYCLAVDSLESLSTDTRALARRA
jgi:hypothetical protein